jgi:outer membrane protein TolC
MLRKAPAACALLIAAVLLGGCVGTPTANEKLARQDLKGVASRYRPEGAGPQLPVLSEDSTLADLMQYALLNSPSVEGAYFDWVGSVEAITTARSLPDPMLQFGLTISNGIPSLSASLMSDPGANWPGPGKLPARADAAYGESMKKRAVFETQLLGTALAVKRAYFQMWVLEEQIRWTRDVLALMENTEAIARQRLTVGKVTEQDVLRAQMERDRLRNQLASLVDSRNPVSARLRSALGLKADDALPPFTYRLNPSDANFTEQSLLDTAYQRNPRLKEMHGEVTQAMALYQLARKSNVPDYSWGIGAGVGPGGVSILPSFGITLPIWRDKIAAEIAQGRSGVDSAKAKLSAEQLDLAVRFAETAYAWREANRTVDLYGNQLLPKAKSALDAARGGYVGGMSTFPDLLDAERSLLEYHVNYAEALAQREMVLAEMSLVILGRWPENVKEIAP